MALFPGKGVFTECILSYFKGKMETKKAMYEKTMNEIFDPANTFYKIKDRVDKYLADSERTLKYKQYEFYVNVDLGELWKVGKEHHIWFHTDKGKLIDFSISREEIRNKQSDILELYDAHFVESPFVKKWLCEVQSWFEGGVVGKPQCRWYETSGNTELWVQIQMKDLYAKVIQPQSKAE
jgi:hypothetical protein